MLLKYIDDLALTGVGNRNEDPDTLVEVSLVELEAFHLEDRPKAQWKEVTTLELPLACLYYDDTADGSNAYITSWQDFFREDWALGDERSPVWGGNKMMKNGSPMFGSVAKAAIYLRYAKGFREWLEQRDSAAAQHIASERDKFETLIDDSRTKRLPGNWLARLRPTNDWVLPVVARTSDGRAVTLGFDENCSKNEILDIAPEAAETIDVDASLELAALLRHPEARLVDIVDGELHAQTGMGRNAFNVNTVENESEYRRLLGPKLRSETTSTRRAWAKVQELQYRIPLSPTPDTSTLLFFPEGDLSFENLARILRWEHDKRRIYRGAWESRNPRAVSAEMDKQPVVGERPNFVPASHSATVFLTGVFGTQKRKRTVFAVHSSVMLYYWAFLNHELLRQSLDWRINHYNRAAITGHERGNPSSDPPSVYGLWTHVFTQALQLGWISARPFWNYFQRYAKSYSTDELINNRRASGYLDILSSLKRLQHLIGVFREDKTPDESLLRDALRSVESGDFLKYGVMPMANTEVPTSAQEFLGEWYDVLWDHQQRKINEFVRRSWQGTPTEEYPAFIRGAMVGMLLSELRWLVSEKAGRRFEATQGRHPSAMRGEIIPNTFSKGVGLLQNTNYAGRYNSKVLPFIMACVPESRTAAFNNGFIMGMAYIPSSTTSKEESDAGAES